MKTRTLNFYLILLFWAMNFSWAQANASTPDTTNLVESSNNILDSVEIGNDDFFTPFIQSDALDESSDELLVKEQIQTRDFAHDEYYMRNIDREEFEQERVLMMFVDEKKKKKFKTWIRHRESEEVPF